MEDPFSTPARAYNRLLGVRLVRLVERLLLFGRFLGFVPFGTSADSLRRAIATSRSSPSCFIARDGRRKNWRRRKNKSRQWITQRLVFGRFLTFATNVASAEKLPKNLSEGRFRVFSKQTSGGNEWQRFQAVWDARKLHLKSFLPALRWLLIKTSQSLTPSLAGRIGAECNAELKAALTEAATTSIELIYKNRFRFPIDRKPTDKPAAKPKPAPGLNGLDEGSALPAPPSWMRRSSKSRMLEQLSLQAGPDRRRLASSGGAATTDRL